MVFANSAYSPTCFQCRITWFHMMGPFAGILQGSFGTFLASALGCGQYGDYGCYYAMVTT